MKKQDLILISAILAIILLAFAVMPLFQADGSYVVVRLDGEEIAKYSLHTDGVYELNGGTNVLCIEGGSAYLLSATCPDHLCVNQGKINNSWQTITCLPNRLTITVYGGQASDIDIIV